MRVPLVPPPVSPLPVAVVTPVIVPVPGKVCPETKVNSPVLLSFNPVSPGVSVPLPKSRFNVAPGVEVLFPVGSACHSKCCNTALLVPLLNDEASKSVAFELKPLLALAFPVVADSNKPRTSSVPFTSKLASGLVSFKPSSRG